MMPTDVSKFRLRFRNALVLWLDQRVPTVSQSLATDYLVVFGKQSAKSWQRMVCHLVKTASIKNMWSRVSFQGWIEWSEFPSILGLWMPAFPQPFVLLNRCPWPTEFRLPSRAPWPTTWWLPNCEMCDASRAAWIWMEMMFLEMAWAAYARMCFGMAMPLASSAGNKWASSANKTVVNSVVFQG